MASGSHLSGPTLRSDLRCDGATVPGCGYRHVQYLEGLPHHGRLGTGRRSPANPALSESHQEIALSSSVFLLPSPSGVKARPLHQPAVDPGRDKASRSHLLCLVCSDLNPHLRQSFVQYQTGKRNGAPTFYTLEALHYSPREKRTSRELLALPRSYQSARRLQNLCASLLLFSNDPLLLRGLIRSPISLSRTCRSSFQLYESAYYSCIQVYLSSRHFISPIPSLEHTPEPPPNSQWRKDGFDTS